MSYEFCLCRKLLCFSDGGGILAVINVKACVWTLECETHFQNKKLEWKIIHYWVSSPTQIDKFWDTVGWGTSGSRGGGAPRPWPPPNAKLARPNYVLASPKPDSGFTYSVQNQLILLVL